MKMNALIATAFALSATSALAAGTGGSVGLAQTVAHLEARYGGEVTAIELDANGDKRPHYHADLRYPQSGIAKLDVDAATLEIVARDSASLPKSAPTLPQIVRTVSGHLPGEIIFAELDAGYDVVPHYDVDVRMPTGFIGRVKVDAQTGQIGWREPAVVADR